MNAVGQGALLLVLTAICGPPISSTKTANSTYTIRSLRLVKIPQQSAQPQEWYSIAARPRNPASLNEGETNGAVEAPYIFCKGIQKLRILPMTWQNGWPVVDPESLNHHTTRLLTE